MIGARRPVFSAKALALLPVFVACFVTAIRARAEQLPLWEAGIGAALLSLPDYRGADQGQTWLLPLAELESEALAVA